MGNITDEGRKIALDKYGVRLLPTVERSHSLAASVIFGPFQVGDYVSISVNEETYIKTGDSSTVATSDDVLLPAGVHDFAVPTGVTHIALFSSISDAVGAIWSS